ncbi:MAG: hypothetical protein LBG06_02990 [Deltaproteobacteria bacterium]|jgi:hypothetical protein|nr:hypothetical protein [Deltaproteobacteria bacterium]
MFKTLLCLVMAVIFTPAGLWTLRAAFSMTDGPHIFVMFVFSGSLMILIGLAGLGGLYFRWRQPGPAGKGAVGDAGSGDGEKPPLAPE